MIVGSLEIDLIANLARLQEDMRKANQTVGTAMDAIEKSVGIATKALGLLGIAASADHFAGLVEGAIKAQAELQRLAERTGASVEALSGMKGIAKLSGTDLDAVAQAAQKLSKAMVESQAGNAKATDAFAKLGISARDVAAHMDDPGKMLQVVAQHMDDFKDGAGKTAVAMELMGKSGANMLPFMHDLAAAGELNAKVTAEQAEAADKLEKLQTQWQNRMKGLYGTIASELVPVMSQFYQALIDHQKAVGSITDATKRLADDGSINSWATDAAKAAAFVYDALAGVVRVVKLTGAGLGALAAETSEIVSTFSANGPKFETLGARLAAIREEYDKNREAILGAQTMQDALAQSMAKTTATAEKHRKTIAVSNEAAADSAKEYEALVKAIHEKIAAEEAEAKNGGKLTEAQKMRAEWTEKLRYLSDALTSSQKEYIAKLIDEAVALKKSNAELEERNKREAEAYAAMVKDTDAILERVEKARLENEEIGLTSQQLAELRMARLDHEIAVKAEQVAVAEKNSTSAAEIELLNEQLEALKRLRQIQESSDVKRANKEAADEAAKEWRRVVDDVNRALTEAIMQGGKTGLEHLKNYAKTFVIRVAVEYATGAIGGAIGIPGFGGSGGVGGMISTASGINSLFGAGLSGLSAGYASGIGEAALGASFVGPSATAATGITGIGASAGNWVASTFGSGVATALPYVGAALAVASLLSSGGGGPKTEGSVFANFDATGFSGFTNTSVAGTHGYTGDSADPTVQKILGPLATTIAALSASLHGNITRQQIELGFNTDPQGSAPDNIAGNIRDASGALIYQHNFNGGRGTYATDLAAESNRITLAALQNAGIDKWAADLIRGVNAVTATDQEVADTLAKLTTATQTYAQAQAASRALIESLKTDSEKLADAHKALADAGLPESASEWKRIASSLDLTSQSGQEMIAKMVSLKGALDLVAQSAQAVQQSAAQSAAAAKIEADRQSLTVQLLQAQGQDSAAVALQRQIDLAKTDPALRDLQQQIWNAQDQAAENARAAAQAANEQAAAQAAANAAMQAAQQAAAQQASALRQTMNQMDSFTKSLSSFRDSLGIGSLSSGDVFAQYRESSALFSRTAFAAASGDTNALGSLQSVITEFLNASKAASPDQIGYARDVARARNALDSAIGFTSGMSEQAAAQLGIPAYASGTDYVPTTGLALVHQGERITPAGRNASESGAVVEELRALRAEVAAMRRDTSQTANATAGTERFLRMASPDGQSLRTTTA